MSWRTIRAKACRSRTLPRDELDVLCTEIEDEYRSSSRIGNPSWAVSRTRNTTSAEIARQRVRSEVVPVVVRKSTETCVAGPSARQAATEMPELHRLSLA